ncbi:glucosamine-6-phosphate deaminase, partial [Acinetobacter baumannii]
EQAVTMGIGTILEARAVLLIATGGAKAPAVAAALGPAITPHCPASALRLHPAAVIVADRAAAAGVS